MESAPTRPAPYCSRRGSERDLDFVFVCVRVHVCVCVRACMCMSMHACACACSCTCVHVCACACVCTCMCVHVHVHMQVLVCETVDRAPGQDHGEGQSRADLALVQWSLHGGEAAGLKQRCWTHGRGMAGLSVGAQGVPPHGDGGGRGSAWLFASPDLPSRPPSPRSLPAPAP